jgi:stage V sporulation protein G
MQITDIRVRSIRQEGRMKAIVSVTFDDSLAVHDIKVIEGQEKLFVAFPSRKTPDGEFKDIVHPINTETRSFLESAILTKYEEQKAEDAENDRTHAVAAPVSKVAETDLTVGVDTTSEVEEDEATDEIEEVETKKKTKETE